MVKSPAFDKNTSSSQAWEPGTLNSSPVNNRSSERFDIITGDANAHSPMLSKNEMSARTHGRNTNITGIRDMLHGSKVNLSSDYSSAFKKNPQVFNRRDGMFTQLYISSKRFGEDKPFKS